MFKLIYLQKISFAQIFLIIINYSKVFLFILNTTLSAPASKNLSNLIFIPILVKIKVGIIEVFSKPSFFPSNRSKS